MSPTDEDGFGDSVFESYRPSGTIKGAKPHPTKLAESAAMSAVRLPKLTYVPNIPSEIVDSGKLSGAQLETIAYAGQAHEQMLPNGERRGMFVGDGCVSGDTMIFDPETGESTQIEALARRGKPITVLALSKDGFVAANATAPFLKGKDDIYRVTLRSGKQVKVTMAHRFLTPEGWRHLRWISQGDCIASAGTALSSHPLVDHYAMEEIESIEFVCHDDFYDMYVPGYENYVANGIIHHNTGVGKGAQIAGIILANRS